MYSEEDLRRALARHSTGQASVSAGTAAAPTGSAAAPPAATPVTAQNPALATIEDARIARQVAGTLAKLESIVDAPAGTQDDRIATIFFDPRCPYCHAAYKALHGKVAARWVPVVVLGEPEAGRRMAAATLSAPDRVAALAATFEAKAPPEKGPSEAAGTPEMLAKLAENHEAFASIFAASPGLRPGVPTMFVPRPDGRLAIMVGYEAGDEAKLATIMAGN